MTDRVTAETVTELTPVAQASLRQLSRTDTQAAIRKALLRQYSQLYRMADIAAEAIVSLAEHQARSLGHIRLAADFGDNQPLGGRHG